MKFSSFFQMYFSLFFQTCRLVFLNISYAPYHNSLISEITNSFFTSRISGRGYRNGPVCVSVCGHTHGWPVWHFSTKFSTGIDLDDILEEFDGQGHRSKVKVTRSKHDFHDFLVWVPRYKTVASGVTWCYVTFCDDTTWRHDVMWRHTWHHAFTKLC